MASHLGGNANHSAAIRNEITRFESVHPSIYAIYDLIEHVPEILQDRIREHVVCIEDSFVNSQEWTLSRSVPDLKLGVLGSVYSGKSALIHRYLTGSYMQDESPEGGRFKKEVVIDGQSFLLLIRDEGSAPDMQFSQWVDAVMFVFSLENETSFNTVYHYFTKMAHYRNTSEVPLILVGTQDAISESNPRIIDESRARKLASDLKRCSYYETCATYGLNVERVLQDACHRTVQRKYPNLLPPPVAGGLPSSGGGAGDSRPTSPQVSTGTAGSGGIQAGPTPRSMYSLPPTPVSSVAMPGPPAPPPPPPATIGMAVASRDQPLYDQVCPEEPIMRVSRQSSRISSKGLLSSLQKSNSFSASVPQPPQHKTGLSPTSTPRVARRGSRDYQSWRVKHSREPTDASVLINPHSQAVPGYHNMAMPRTRHSTSAAPVPPDAGGVQKGDRLEAYLAEALRAMPAVGSAAPMPLAPLSTVAVPPAVSVNQAIGGDYYHILSARPSRDRTSFANTASSTTMSGIVPAAQSESSKDGKDLPTPSSTPTQGRKQNRRKSNLFKKGEEEKKTNGIGSGRMIPLKQGTLYKKGSNPLSRDWKKKYVVVEENRLTIFTNLNDYMENVRGKEVDLSRATVKIPGQYRPGRGAITSNGLLKSHLNDLSAAAAASANSASVNSNIVPSAGGAAVVGSGSGTANSRRSGGSVGSGSGPTVGGQDAVIISNDSMAQAYLSDFIFKSGQESANTTLSKTKETPAAKKRHKRAKSGAKMGTGDGYDSDGYEFMIVNMDSKQWHFEAGSSEERDEWVSAIEQAILNSLQIKESYRTAAASSSTATSRGGCMTGTVTADIVQTVRNIAGNDQCADCGALDPGWASLNLGALLCIDCSGVHRQLGTHISRVRSLELDDWPNEHVAVMKSIGNTLANSVWEAAVPLNAGNRRKPGPTSPREEIEAWIRAKYDKKEFLPPVPYPDAPIQQQLIDAIAREDTRQVVLCLAVANDAVNAPYSKQDPRAAIHIAATLGQMVYLQLLLWYNANVRVVDHEGRNAFFYAQASGKTECAEFLKMNGCPEQGVPSLMSPAAYHQATAAVAATLPRRRRMGPNEIGL